MSDKPLGVLAAALVAAPLCATCIAGPVAIGSAFAWVSGLLGDFGWLALAVVGIAVALLIRNRVRWARLETNVRESPGRTSAPQPGAKPQ